MKEEFKSWANNFEAIYTQIKTAQETFRDETSVSTHFLRDLENTLRSLRRVSETCLEWTERTESKWICLKDGGPNPFEISHSLRCFDGENIARLILEIDSFMMLSIRDSDQKRINTHVSLETKLKKTAGELRKFIQELEKGYQEEEKNVDHCK